MASMETICARLCLLTPVGGRKEGRPLPLSRASVQRMVRLGAIEGLALRNVSDVKPEVYERAEALLSRSAQVYAKLERYCALGYDVLLPEDDGWPVNLNALGMQMPQFLFVKGNHSLLAKHKVAVAGSRQIAQETIDIAGQCGAGIANAGLTMVCGGALGVDTSAQQGALDCGGSLILVPALPAREMLRQTYLQQALEDGNLLLCCDTWPDEPFSSLKALSRNHTIYALGDAALVVASRNGTGGSWRGATDCLREGYTPVYVISTDDEDMAGNRALLEMGAKRFDTDKPIGRQLFPE